jgi:hypothetical protein
MTNHADHRRVQENAAAAIEMIVGDIGNHIALAKAAVLVPLLQHAAGMRSDAEEDEGATFEPQDTVFLWQI